MMRPALFSFSMLLSAAYRILTAQQVDADLFSGLSAAQGQDKQRCNIIEEPFADDISSIRAPLCAMTREHDFIIYMPPLAGAIEDDAVLVAAKAAQKRWQPK